MVGCFRQPAKQPRSGWPQTHRHETFEQFATIYIQRAALLHQEISLKHTVYTFRPQKSLRSEKPCSIKKSKTCPAGPSA